MSTLVKSDAGYIWKGMKVVYKAEVGKETFYKSPHFLAYSAIANPQIS